MSNKYTNEYIVGTIQEVAELSALEISKNYALDRLAENGVVTQEEVASMHSLAMKILSEGSEDFIPETLELPEDEAPEMEDELPEDEDMGDLDVADLEGIVLPDAEGNQYMIQNGVIVPYGEEEEVAPEMEEEAPAEEEVIDTTPEAATDVPAVEEEVQESATEVPADVETITESETFSGYSANSNIVQKLIDDMKFR